MTTNPFPDGVTIRIPDGRDVRVAPTPDGVAMIDGDNRYEISVGALELLVTSQPVVDAVRHIVHIDPAPLPFDEPAFKAPEIFGHPSGIASTSATKYEPANVTPFPKRGA